MDDLTRLIETLHPLERAVIPHLTRAKTVVDLASSSGLQMIEVERATQWLENKGVVSRRSVVAERVRLGGLGKEYAQKGLPERRLLIAITKPSAIKDLAKLSLLSDEECGVSLGVLKSKAAISVSNGIAERTPQGTDLLEKKTGEEELLKEISGASISTDSLSEQAQLALNNLKKRRDIVEIFLEKTVVLTLTGLGKRLVEQKIETRRVIDRLTPEHLKMGLWKEAKVRRYDVTINVPRVSFGRKHHYRAYLDSVRNKFAALGFVEMAGPIVETEFWDMDALFMPQFHSARDIHEAYYIKEPQSEKLDLAIVEKVRQAHENGYGTGSKGWRYKFDLKRTQRTILRTQGTACSARMLASKNLRVPGKYFGIAKNFRYDVIDQTHLPDFFQTEGIVLEDGLSMAHLKGLLKLFAEEFAETSEIKIRSGYFPFTEPSCELFAKHPDLGWIELGGAGIFRPELTKPLGVNVPVIAWGLGIDRLGMLKMGIKDIRDLYSHDLEFLKYTRVL